MSDEKQDEVRAIIAEMRADVRPYGIGNDRFQSYADRLDVAYDQKLKEIADVVSQLDGRDLVIDTDLSRKLDALLSPCTSAQKAGEIEQRAPGDAQKAADVAHGNAAAMREAQEIADKEPDLCEWQHQFILELKYQEAMSCLADALLVAREREYNGVAVLVEAAKSDLDLIGELTGINGQKKIEGGAA